MKTYLLAWNPKRWPWIAIGDMSDKIKIGKVVHHGWSCGNSKKPKKGDRFFLICLGQEPKGIFASGEIEGDSYEDIHWDEIKASLGETTHYVKIKYDTLFNPETDSILPRDLLNMPPLSEMHWDTQRSGVQIPDNVAKELETLWASFINSTRFSFPEEIEQTQEENVLNIMALPAKYAALILKMLMARQGKILFTFTTSNKYLKLEKPIK
jgi:5-methylcytosine-specific restriction protein A